MEQTTTMEKVVTTPVEKPPTNVVVKEEEKSSAVATPAVAPATTTTAATPDATTATTPTATTSTTTTPTATTPTATTAATTTAAASLPTLAPAAKAQMTQTGAMSAMSGADPATTTTKKVSTEAVTPGTTTTPSSTVTKTESGSNRGRKKGGRRYGSHGQSTPNYSWTPEEDKLLQEGVKQKGDNSWTEIGLMVGRNPGQCQQRWKNFLMPGLKKGVWDFREDELLRKHTTAELRLCGRLGKRVNWTNVAMHIPNRTAKQCRERWVNHLDPDVKKISWTLKEDQLLLKLEAQHPNKWAKIARHMEGRTENMVKVRFKTLTRNPSKIGKMPNLRTRSPNGTRKDYAAARKAKLEAQRSAKDMEEKQQSNSPQEMANMHTAHHAAKSKRPNDGLGPSGNGPPKRANSDSSNHGPQQPMMMPGALSLLHAAGAAAGPGGVMPFNPFQGAVGQHPTAAAPGNGSPSSNQQNLQQYMHLLQHQQQFSDRSPSQRIQRWEEMQKMLEQLQQNLHPPPGYGQQGNTQQPRASNGSQSSPVQGLNAFAHQQALNRANSSNQANGMNVQRNDSQGHTSKSAQELHPLVVYLLQLAHMVNEATTPHNALPSLINTEGMHGFSSPNLNTVHIGNDARRNSNAQQPNVPSMGVPPGLPPQMPQGAANMIPPHVLQEVANILQAKMGNGAAQGNGYDNNAAKAVQQQMQQPSQSLPMNMHPTFLAHVVQQASQQLPRDQQQYMKPRNDAAAASWMLHSMQNSQHNPMQAAAAGRAAGS